MYRLYTFRRMNISSTDWGPHYWFFLHTIAYHYPPVPDKITKRKYYDFIQNIPLFIPDKKISKNFENILAKYPVSPYLDKRQTLIQWMNFIHNKINVQLRKSEISLVESVDVYIEKYIFKKKKTKKQIIVYVTLCILLFFLGWYCFSKRISI
jgi:hypothetical protein